MKKDNKFLIIFPGWHKWYTVLLSLIFVSGILVLDSCKKETEEETPIKQAYSNPNDNSTTSIDVSIPRITLSNTKNTTITVFLSVTDQDGNPFRDFNEYNFTIKQICEGKTDTTLVASITFTRADVLGYDIASSLVLDFSGSMSGKPKRDMQSAAKKFVRLKKALDYCEIIKFDDQIQVTQGFTRDTALLVTAIDSSFGGGSTAFYDATHNGIAHTASFMYSHYGVLPAVVAFTDGLDNSSMMASLLSCVTQATYEQIPVYTIGYTKSVDSLSLQSLAYQTGGRYYFTPNSEELLGFYSKISGQLENEYMLSWNFDDPGCMKVWVFVDATYSCANGTFTAKAQKYLYAVKKHGNN